jgi:hypothetical protein
MINNTFIKSKQKVIILINLFIWIIFNQSTLSQFAGGTGTVNDPFLIETAEQLNGIGQDQSHWDKHFKQITDIDLSVYSGDEFNIIGIEGNGGENFPYTGIFDGNGYEIRNFTYESSERGVAIFECVDYPGELRNITIVNPMINCPQSPGVAALVFQLFNGIIDSCNVLGGTISGSGAGGVGGLVANYWTQDSPSPGAGTTKIIYCHVTANVSSASGGVGGLVGINHGRIQKCSSSGSVSGIEKVGGLTCLNGYWGYWNTLHGEISDCYSTSNVSGTSKVGGLVGEAGASTSITNCYAIGEVTGTSEVGGLVGSGSLTVQSSFWDTVSSGISTSRGGTGLSTAEMQNPATYQNAGWDLETIWEMQGNSDYPKLRSLNITTNINMNNLSPLPSKIQLCQNYPNPFNPSTTIQYNLQKSGNVILKIYNLSGQQIEMLVNGFQTVGEHKITWQPKGLPSGIYFYKLQVGEYSKTKELILEE